jgi:hypothetical protein
LTPVAAGFAVVIVMAMARRARPRTEPLADVPESASGVSSASASRRSRQKPVVLAALAGGAFVVAIALLYGSTFAPSPRDGVQPVEFSDEAFYAVLGRDLATTGTETNTSSSGFSHLPGLPVQTWYHWPELWLAAGVITAFGTEPLHARYFIVLPLVLLAAATLTGTLVRRMAGGNSRRAYLFGLLTCLFLAPLPVGGTYFSAWAVGLIFGISLYGLSAVSVLLVLYMVAIVSGREATWTLAGFVGCTVAFILPAHIIIAALVLVGVSSAWCIWIARSLVATGRLPSMPRAFRRALMASGVAVVATIALGTFTGHGLGGSASAPIVATFNYTWQGSVASVYLGAGAFLAIPVAAWLLRNELAGTALICFGAAAIVVFGAIAWGARLDDFSMFHVFFGGIAVLATPVAGVAAWILLHRLHRTRHASLAIGAATLCGIQLAVGVATATVRLQEFGPRLHNEPVALILLDVIRQLPPEAKLAYACRPFEEISFADASLVSLDAHTGRRVVPMCFEADVVSTLHGVRASDQVASAGFSAAPQSALYPDAAARPSSSAVAAFLKANGIQYIYADSRHPNVLVPDAVQIAADRGGQVLRVP